MSKVRREKHKDLVLYQIFEKRCDRYNTWHNTAPRWRQAGRAIFEQVIKESKK